MLDQNLIEAQCVHYNNQLAKYGAAPQCVDYSNSDTQRLAFDQLTELFDPHLRTFSLNDYGCGYGAYFTYLKSRYLNFTYTGYDISQAMINEAHTQTEQRRQAAGLLSANSTPSTDYPNFTTDKLILKPADYTIASNIFGSKLTTFFIDWQTHIEQTLDHINALSTKGFAFNMHSDQIEPSKTQMHFHYADAETIFTYCMQKYSKKVALLHDYSDQEFTILVRK